MRAIISPSGSFKAIARFSLPARLEQTRNHALGAEIPKRDAAHLELAVVAFGTTADHAAVVDARRRGVARQLGELERGREPVLHRLGLVARDRLELLAPLRILPSQLLSSLIFFDGTLLRH